MRKRIFILPLLLCAATAGGAHASDNEYEWDDATITYEPAADVAGTEVYRDEQTSIYIDAPGLDVPDVSVVEQTSDTGRVEINRGSGYSIVANNSDGQQSVQINHGGLSANISDKPNSYRGAAMGQRADTATNRTMTTNHAASYSSSNLMPMRNAKLLSIKPAPIDNRPPVWDGTDGNYKPTAHVKTVDWRNGIPIWDDSISDYRTKDFRDWMLKRLPELYIRDSDDAELVTLYNETVEDINATNARIEELLGNKQITEVNTKIKYPFGISNMLIVRKIRNLTVTIFPLVVSTIVILNYIITKQKLKTTAINKNERITFHHAYKSIFRCAFNYESDYKKRNQNRYTFE